MSVMVPVRQSSGIPITRAYVAPDHKYSDQNVVNWIGQPINVEREFIDNQGEWIRDDYVSYFASEMDNWVHFMDFHDSDSEKNGKGYQYPSEIFFLSCYVDTAQHVFVLQQIYIRPAAENMGIYKLILFQIARYCVTRRCNLYVETPLDATCAVLESMFGKVGNGVLYETGFVPEYTMYKQCTTDYYFVSLDYLKDMNLITVCRVAEMLDPNPNLNALIQGGDGKWHIPPLRLNTSFHKFKHARVMNHGPQALLGNGAQGGGGAAAGGYGGGGGAAAVGFGGGGKPAAGKYGRGKGPLFQQPTLSQEHQQFIANTNWDKADLDHIFNDLDDIDLGLGDSRVGVAQNPMQSFPYAYGYPDVSKSALYGVVYGSAV